MIVARGPAAELAAEHPDETVVDLREGLVLPGFVDTHVHFPQVRAIGGLGMPLLDWLERCALPEEARLADAAYAASVAADFVDGLARAGTTTALVFGSHFADAVDALFTEATRVGLRVTSGLVLSDRILREDLFTTPERAHAEGLALAKKRLARPRGRTRYAVTPRFSLSCTDELLESAGALLSDVPDALVHLPPQREPQEIAGVRELFGCDYATSYDKHGLLGARSVLAHNVHPTVPSCGVLGHHGAAVAHCPTSNAALGSGLFPLGAHLPSASGWRSAPTSGRAPGSRCSRRACRPTSPSSCSGLEGHRLTAGHLLHLATAAGARRARPDQSTATSRSARSTTPSGCAPSRARPSMWRCGTPTPPKTRWPRPSRSPPRPTCTSLGRRNTDSSARPERGSR